MRFRQHKRGNTIGQNSVATEDDHVARRNVLILACAQALSGANSWVVFSTAGIVSSVLVSDRSLVTVPVSTFMLGMWAGTLPTGAITRHLGRRAAFEVGALCGVLAGLVCALAVVLGSFLLLCVGTFLGGLYAAVGQSYRFAAADTASKSFKPKAISWVLAGGVFSAILGPQLAIFTKDLLGPYLFAATYLAQAIIAAVAAAVLMLVRIPAPMSVGHASGGRSIFQALRQPRLLAAILCGMTSCSMMNMVMTSAPVAMVACGYSIADAALGIQWHVIGMYGPSFFTGAVIAWLGAERVATAGIAILVSGAFVASSGTTIAHFWTALVLLGLGWNCAFVGATSMVADCQRPEERTKLQAVNDFLVFGSMVAGSFLSGFQLAHFGWAVINYVVIAILLLSALVLGWAVCRTRAQRTA